MSKLIKALFIAASLMVVPPVSAEVISAKGDAEVIVKEYKGDVIAAKRVARKVSEADAVVAAIKLKLNIDPNNAKSKAAVADMVSQLTDSLKTTFNLEGDVLTAKTTLEVESSQIMSLAKSLGIGSQAAVASSSVLFIIDEYSGISTASETGQPIETEMEYFADKSSFSDKSAKASGSDSSSDSSSASSKSASAYSSKSASAVKASDAVAVKSKDSASVSSKERATGSASDSVALKDRTGSAAATSKRSGSASSDYNAKADSEFSGAASSKYSAASASKKAGATSEQSASASASASASDYSSDVKDVQEQKDITSIKIKSKFPDVNNAKPSVGSNELIAPRLAEIARKFGIEVTPEQDFRVEGGNKLLIRDIERLNKFAFYKQKASKGPFKVNYLVYGTAVLNLEGKTPSGMVKCEGNLKVESTSIDSGRSLFSSTLTKSATGSSDQNCNANLSNALATELAEKISTSTLQQIQLTATQGSSFDLNLYSVLKVPFKVKKGFTDELKKICDEFAEGNSTETTKSFILQSKSDIKDKVEELMEGFREQLPEIGCNALKIAKA
jgi:hypothetical protein